MTRQYAAERLSSPRDFLSDFRNVHIVADKQAIFAAVGRNVEGRDVFIKGFYGKTGYSQGVMEYNALKRVSSIMPTGAKFAVPEAYCLNRMPDGGGLIQAQLIKINRGDKWFKYFSNIGFLRSHALSNVARWLSQFHQIEQKQEKKFSEIVDLDAFLDNNSIFLGCARFGTDDFLSRFSALKDKKVARSLLHTDLTPSNMFIDYNKVVVFDFALNTEGAIYRDISKFLVSLIWLSRPLFGKYNYRHFRNDISLFCSGYEEGGPLLDTSILSFYLIEAIAEKIKAVEKRSNAVQRSKQKASAKRHSDLLLQLSCDMLATEDDFST